MYSFKHNMNGIIRQLFLLTIALTALTACGGGISTRSSRGGEDGEAVDSITFKYARLIHIEQHDGYQQVSIDNPWKPGKVLHRYVLVPYGATQSNYTEQGATVIRIPLQKSIIFTSVHAALVGQLHAEKQVAGVADLKYMKVSYVQEGVASGQMTDCGDGLAPLIEKIIDTEADGILLSPFENSGGYGQLEDIGIPLIECAEYMEQTPLARAEWVRFYGLLYGCQAEADSLFAVVDSSYHALCEMAAEAGKGRSVLVDKQTGSVWYVPGGHSTIGRMLVDAGADYAFADDEHSGSLSLSFETVLERAGESDVWLFRYDNPQPITLSQLLGEQPGYRQLRPVREQGEGRIYGCNVSTSMFYEETPFRPDLLLQDFIQISHPDIPNLPPLRYYHQIK